MSNILKLPVPPRKTAFAKGLAAPRSSPFDDLNARLVLDQYRAGTLPEGIFVAMMASAGLVVHP